MSGHRVSPRAAELAAFSRTYAEEWSPSSRSTTGEASSSTSRRLRGRRLRIAILKRPGVDRGAVARPAARRGGDGELPARVRRGQGRGRRLPDVLVAGLRLEPALPGARAGAADAVRRPLHARLRGAAGRARPAERGRHLRGRGAGQRPARGRAPLLDPGRGHARAAAALVGRARTCSAGGRTSR